MAQEYAYNIFSTKISLSCYLYQLRKDYANYLKKYRGLAQLLSAQAIGAVGLGFDSRAGQIGTARHRCDVSSGLCCPGAKPRKWAPPLVTRFGVLTRV